MPWYAWLFLAVAVGSVVGSLLLLRDSADKMPISEEELQRMRERNAALDAQEQREKNENR